MNEHNASRAPDAGDIDVLRRRAAVLARVPRRERQQERVDVISFELGDEHFALAATHVLEVAILREFTPLPGAQAPLFGVTHWRGSVLTVLDLRSVLGVRARGLSDLGRIIVMEGEARDFGVLADRVHGIIEIEVTALGTVAAGEGERASLLRGITPDAMLLLDEEALLERYGKVKHRDNRG